MLMKFLWAMLNIQVQVSELLIRPWLSVYIYIWFVTQILFILEFYIENYLQNMSEIQLNSPKKLSE